MRTRWLSIVLTVALALGGMGVRLARAAVFTPGNLVVTRVGDGSAALSGNAAPVFLDEYTIAGSPVQTIAAPVADNGANQMLTMAGNATSEGSLNLSADKNYLTFAGYDAAPGTVAVNGTTSSVVHRIVARVGIDGVVDTTTHISDAFNGGNIRSAVTDDGTRFWAGGNTTQADGSGGTHHVVYGSSGASTLISVNPTNTRTVKIFKGQLYSSSGLSPYIGINQVGSGLPTAAGQTTTLLSGMPSTTGSPYSFVLFDINADMAGVDTLYMADSTNGLRKYSFDGSTWTARGSLTGLAFGLTARRVVTGVELYVIDSTGAGGFGAGNRIYRITDTAAYNANITNNGSNINAGTLLATAAANTVFRGIAFTPGSADQVDPTAISLRDLAARSGYPLPVVGVGGVLLVAAAAAVAGWRRIRLGSV